MCSAAPHPSLPYWLLTGTLDVLYTCFRCFALWYPFPPSSPPPHLACKCLGPGEYDPFMVLANGERMLDDSDQDETSSTRGYMDGMHSLISSCPLPSTFPLQRSCREMKQDQGIRYFNEFVIRKRDRLMSGVLPAHHSFISSILHIA